MPAVMAACSAEQPVAQYSGYYKAGFEVSEFRPVGSTERWWLVGQLSPSCNIPMNYSYIYLEIVGVLGPSGNFGHPDRYDREIRALDTITCRAVRTDELGELYMQRSGT